MQAIFAVAVCLTSTAIAQDLAVAFPLPVTAPPPTDIPSIVARFQVMQNQVDLLTQQAAVVSGSIAGVEAMAHGAATGIATAQVDIARVGEIAGQNSAEARQLTLESDNATRGVEAAETEVHALRETVQTLSETAGELAGSSAGIGISIGRLEADVAAHLPDAAAVNARVAAANQQVQAYQARANQGVGPLVAESLHRNFLRAAGHIDALAAEVRFPTGPAPGPAPAVLSPM